MQETQIFKNRQVNVNTVRVLIVDDNYAQCEAIRDLLLEQYNPIEFEILADPAEAKALLARFRPNVIFLEVDRTGWNGVDYISLYQEVCPNAYIVIIDAHGGKEFAIRALRLGVADYLRKPVDPQDVLAVFERLMVKQRERRLREKRFNQYQFMVEQANNWFITLDRSGVIESANKAAMAHLGGKDHVAIGRHVWNAPWIKNSHSDAEGLKHLVQNMAAKKATHHNVNEVFLIRHLNNSSRHFRFTIKPIFDVYSLELQNILVEGEDVTDLLKLRLALNELGVSEYCNAKVLESGEERVEESGHGDVCSTEWMMLMRLAEAGLPKEIKSADVASQAEFNLLVIGEEEERPDADFRSMVDRENVVTHYASRAQLSAQTIEQSGAKAILFYLFDEHIKSTMEKIRSEMGYNSIPILLSKRV